MNLPPGIWNRQPLSAQNKLGRLLQVAWSDSLHKTEAYGTRREIDPDSIINRVEILLFHIFFMNDGLEYPNDREDGSSLLGQHGVPKLQRRGLQQAGISLGIHTNSHPTKIGSIWLFQDQGEVRLG